MLSSSGSDASLPLMLVHLAGGNSVPRSARAVERLWIQLIPELCLCNLVAFTRSYLDDLCAAE